jgi:phosphate-selective porin OprO/OprP
MVFGLPERGWAQEDEGTVQVGAEGVRLASPDGAFEVRLRNDLYIDARMLPGTDAAPGAERVYLRRVRPRLQGRVYERFAFSVRPDFSAGGPEIDDAYVEVRVAPSVRVRMGRFKVPVGLESLQSTTGLMHVERGFPTGLVPGRDVGLMVAGEGGDGRLSYAAGLFNGAPGGTGGGADVDDAKEGAARLFAEPFASQEGALSGLGVGVAGTWGHVTGTDAAPALTSLRTTGRQTFFEYRAGAQADGTRWRVAPQARLYAGPVELLGEYTVAGQDVRQGVAEETLTHQAWQASASVVLTGEDAREGAVVPQDPFAAERGLGAFELGVRVHGASFDEATFPTFASPDTAAEARAWGGTLSWYPNRMVRFMLGVERTTFDTAGIASPPGAETLLLFRTQLVF